MRMKAGSLACMAILVGLFQPALADPANGAATSDPVAQLPPPPQVANKLKTKCTTEKAMGSHIKRRTCRSQEDIDRQRAESRAYTDGLRDRASNIEPPK